MSVIKTIDMSNYSSSLDCVNAVLSAAFGVTVDNLNNPQITILGGFPAYVHYSTSNRSYSISVSEDGKSFSDYLDLCTPKSSIVYCVAGDDYVSIWGSNNSNYKNAIIKILDDTYLCANSSNIIKVDGTSFTTTRYDSNGCWPQEGDDSYVSGIVLPLFHVSGKKEQNFVTDRCYFVTRAGDFLTPGSEVTVGDETYIILTQGWNVLSSQSTGFNLAVKKV